MNCCDGTGYVLKRGDLELGSGAIRTNVEYVVRCPEYVRYFDSEAIRKHPENFPVRRYSGACRAAIRVHEEAITRAKRKGGRRVEAL